MFEERNSSKSNGINSTPFYSFRIFSFFSFYQPAATIFLRDPRSVFVVAFAFSGGILPVER